MIRGNYKPALVLCALALTTLLGGCGTGGIGDQGGIFGGPSSGGTTQPGSSANVEGTVTNVDTRAQRIDLSNATSNLRSSGGGSTISIYYDSRTQVVYQNKNYTPADLESGDQISVHGYNSSGQFVADSISVTRNARESGGYGNPSSNPPVYGNQNGDIQGAVDSVDTRARRIDIIADSMNGYPSGRTSVYYDAQTRLNYQGQNMSPDNLERGDRISVRSYNSNGRLLADTITITADVRGGGTSGSPVYQPGSQLSEIQGTVSSVDTRNQRIEVTVDYINRLQSSNSLASIYYDSRTRVLYQNRTYAPANLERGDQVDIQASDNAGRYLADTITVTRSVRQ